MIRTLIHGGRRTLIILSLFAINPISSIMFGTPMPFPFPAIPEPSPGTVAIMNIASLCTTLLGGIVGVTFWLDRRNKNELTKLDTKIDKNTTELKNSISAVGENLCKLISDKNDALLENTDLKLNKFKEIADERFKNMNERFVYHKERIDRMDTNHRDYSNYRPRHLKEEENDR
jgi:hypothetical protein